MTTEYFRVRNGLAVGEDLVTVDALTGDTAIGGDLVVTGDLTVNGTTTTLNTDTLIVEDNEIVLNGGVTGSPVLDASIIVNRGTGTDASLTWNETTDKWEQNRNGTSTVIPISTSELNEGTNLYYTTSRSNDDFDTRLATKSTTNLAEGTNLYYTTTRSNSDFDTRLATKSTDDLTQGSTNLYYADSLVDSHLSGGTGVTYSAGEISIGQSVATTDSPTFSSLTLSSDLDVRGSDITNSTGALNITTASNGNITLDPNGTGDIVLTLANGGNLTNTRNYVMGAIRNSTTESIGDIWATNSTGPNNPFRGISIDNSADTTRGPGTLMRSYSGGAVSGSGTRGRIVFEKARGTSASPTANQAGDFLGSVDGTGYTSTGWVNDNIAAVIPASISMFASENWVSNTNLGSRFSLTLAPTATTITSAANLVTTIESSPESGGIRNDRMALSQGKTSTFTATGCSTSGTTLTIGTLTSGTIGVGNVITVSNSPPLQNHYIVANISGSGSGSTWTLSGSPGTLTAQSITGNKGFIGSNPANSITTDILQDLRLITNTIKNSAAATVITLSGTDVVLAGDLRVNGGDIQNPGGTSAITLTSANTNTTIKGDSITLEKADGTDLISLGATTTNSYIDKWFFRNSVTTNNTNNYVSLRPGNVAAAGFSDRNTGLFVFNQSISATDAPTINFANYAYNTGTNNYVPTAVNDSLGEFYFSGQYGSGSTATTAGSSVRFRAEAAENFTGAGNYGGRFIAAVRRKNDSTFNDQAISIDESNAYISADTITLKSSSATAQPYLVLNGSTATFTTTAGNPLPGGNINYRRTFGCFHKTANITAAAANTVYNFDWYTSTTAHVGNQGVTVTSGNPTRLNIDTQGSYEVVVEMQAKNSDVADRTAWVWLAKNGTDLSETRIKVTLRASGGSTVYQMITKMWCVDNLAANDYLELRFAVDNTSGISLEYEAAQTSPFAMPAQPSATITVSPIGA